MGSWTKEVGKCGCGCGLMRTVRSGIGYYHRNMKKTPRKNLYSYSRRCYKHECDEPKLRVKP